MSMTTPQFVYCFIGITSLAPAIVLIIVAGCAGWWQSPSSLVFWRGVKLSSAALGFLGILMLFLNVDIAARQVMEGNCAQTKLLHYINAKIRISEEIAAWCYKPLAGWDDQQTYSDIQNLN